MSAKLINSKVIGGEKRWTYELKITFNGQKINWITITDHFQQKKGREKITKELILDILREELNNKRFLPTNYSGTRKVYLRDKILHKDKRYRLIFWFKDGSDDHLWIRNCHEQD